jgi:hypothetical protein
MALEVLPLISVVWEKTRSKKMQLHFTDLAVSRLKTVGIYYDSSTPAFGIRIGKNRKTWLVIRGRALELGYNLFTEDGNKKMAEYLSENYCTEPWSHNSEACWVK